MLSFPYLRGRKRYIAIACATSCLLTGASASSHFVSDRTGCRLAPVGIVNATPHEQAAVLAKMIVTGHRDVAGYRYYLGTINGAPVVNVAGGEMAESSEMATWILDETFHPRATVFSGTAGAQNAAVNVGDVVLSGFVADKSSIHYQAGGYQSPNGGIEIPTTNRSDVNGAVVSGYGGPYPTPTNLVPAPGNDHHWVFVSAFSATKALNSTAQNVGSIGAESLSDATGDPKAKGSFANKIVIGAIGQANVWTEPLSWIEAQNMVYQTDAEENEGSGFAFANSMEGVPWTLVRGISDTPWYPNAYDNLLAASRAANVTAYLVSHLPASISKNPTSLADLSQVANARQAGYLVANQAAYSVSPVTEVSYTDQNGGTHALSGPALVKLEQEYRPGAAHPATNSARSKGYGLAR